MAKFINNPEATSGKPLLGNGLALWVELRPFPQCRTLASPPGALPSGYQRGKGNTFPVILGIQERRVLLLKLGQEKCIHSNHT